MILVILQNAWAHNERGAAWMRNDPDVWLWATERSRSGQRLKIMLGHQCFARSDIKFGNTTPEVGIGSSAKLPAQPAHIKKLIADHDPRVVVACGLQAELAVPPCWDGDLLCVPHPASRLLTNQLYLLAGKLLISKQQLGRLALRQRRGSVEVEDLVTGATFEPTEEYLVS